MITFLEDLIGCTYSEAPVPFVLGFMLTSWLLYLLIQLLYSILGLNK